MNAPIEQIVAGAVSGIGVVILIVDRVAQRFQDKRRNGRDPDYIVGIKASLEDLKAQSARHHEGIEIIKVHITKLESNCSFHRTTQDRVNSQFGSHLESLDKKIYDLATKE
jgi:hypothetical protein